MSKERHVKFVGRYFEYAHLPDHLRRVSEPFHDMAHGMLTLPAVDEDELMEGLRKLLEAKDCAVRSMLAD